MKHDPIHKPDHYTWVPEIECLDVVKWFPFCSGNAIKYIWRCGRKGGEQEALDDLRKAIFYLNREIENRISGDRQTKTQYVNGKELSK